MRTADFDYELPSELIAQIPVANRDESRLMVLHRNSGRIEHRPFRDILTCLKAGDVLVLNNSRVISARLRGANVRTGGRFEILLIEENGVNDWWAMMRPAKRARIGSQITLLNPRGELSNVTVTVRDRNEEGHRRLLFSGAANILGMLDQLGEVPLPPYIRREPPVSARASSPVKSADLRPGEFPKPVIANAPGRKPTHRGMGEGSGTSGSSENCDDRERYQTVYAHPPGSVAAPTAGLHFTKELLAGIRARGVQVYSLTLHVGLGTFAPVKAETVAAHRMHEERYEVSAETANAINHAKESGHRIVAVGTTTVRVLESVAASHHGHLVPGGGRTRIFLHPPYPFRIADALLTNFHLPRSTLLMLVSAFAAPNKTRGREMVLAAYAEAVRQRYRFFSYGDAMLVC